MPWLPPTTALSPQECHATSQKHEGHKQPPPWLALLREREAPAPATATDVSGHEEGAAGCS